MNTTVACLLCHRTHDPNPTCCPRRCPICREKLDLMNQCPEFCDTIIEVDNSQEVWDEYLDMINYQSGEE